MIATTHTTRAEVIEPATRRDLIGTLLLGRIEWTDRHPRLMFALLGLSIVVGLAICPEIPQ